MDANQDRREYKFLLPVEECEMFRQFIAVKIPADRGAEGGYPVISEYFDTPDRHSYWQKIWGVGNRRRVRARVYGRADGEIAPAAFIEIKHKLDGVGVKRRAAISMGALTEFSNGKIPAELLKPVLPRAELHVVEELRDLVLREGARPVVQIRYDRMAYDSGKDGTIRVTFDTGLRCRFDLKPLVPGDTDFPLNVLGREASLVEVKTIGPVPIWLREATGKFRLNSQSISKYCNSLERYDPAVAMARAATT